MTDATAAAATAPPAVPDGYMKDSKGRLVPIGIIKPVELLEDQDRKSTRLNSSHAS